MSDYFNEFKTGEKNAWKVVQSTWKLYEGLTSAFVLNPSIPTVPFKIAITLLEDGEHSDCSGSAVVGDETLDFDGPTRKITDLDHLFLPDISIDDLDCKIEVECITSSCAPIYREVLEAMEIVCFPKTNIRRDASGSGSMTTYYEVYTDEAPLKIGDHIRYNDPLQGSLIDIYVKDVSGGIDIEGNTEAFRIFYCA